MIIDCAVFDIDFTIQRTDRKPPQLMIMKCQVGPYDDRIKDTWLKPLELEDYIRPEPLDVQARLHKVVNPWAEPQHTEYRTDF